MNYRHFLEPFKEVVERQPAKTAILVEGRHAYSYRQLEQKALRIAYQLLDAGVVPGTVVGIGISKSADYIAAMLGVWYARAAFLPLDPELPSERVEFIIKQSGMGALLVKPAGEALFERVARDLDVALVPVDDDWVDYGKEPEGAVISTPSTPAAPAPSTPAAPAPSTPAAHKLNELAALAERTPADQLAYIIYTSGSTGRPKGVAVAHRGIVNFIDAQIEGFKLTSESIALFFLSTNFDASVSDIGTALLSGATLVIEPQGLLCPGPHFMPLLKERNITHMDIPPSVLKTLDPEEKPDSLEAIIIGGEACAPEVVRAWASKCLVVNVYGPTEATVCTSFGACDPLTWQRPLIGQPISGVEYKIFDDGKEPVEPHVPGELYIGGISLAIGYVNEPELTDKKFVTVRGERLYRTGDQVVLRDDGEIEFLGRVDRQFKLRGMLIEPEEIESKIASHPEVARVAVLKRPLRSLGGGNAQGKEQASGRGVSPGGGGDKLVAFVSRKSGSALDASSLKKYLSKGLPLWMVPALFEFMEELPATITGKVDYGKLREMPLSCQSKRASVGAVASSNESVSCNESVSPSVESLTATQAVLVEVWEQVFELDSVSLDDDFYDLGGDSLNIVEAVVAAHVRGLTISPDLIAAYSSIDELSRAIDEERADDAQAGVSAMDSSAIRENIEPEISALRSLALNSDRTAGVRPHTAGSTSPAAAGAESVALTQGSSNIFLTGATGFLGSRLLDELLDRTNATIHCLVRSNSQSAGLVRIKQALKSHDKFISIESERRLAVVCGSLEQARFGLKRDEWQRLCNEMDVVVHCAAAVNMVKDYFELRPVNLEGTAHIAALCLGGRIKPLHYASTLSVFVATTNNTGVACEDDDLAAPCTVYGGYAQTKFASEMLLRAVGDAGIQSATGFPISYYRFGLLTGDSASGLSAKDDFLNVFIAGISALGSAPECDANVAVDITPVDYAAKAMAHVVTESSMNTGSFTYHIANESSLALNDLMTYIRDSGVDVETVSSKVFLERLGAKAKTLTTAESAACLALCRSLGSDASFERFRTMDLFQATDIRFDCSNTLAALKGTSIACPPPDAQLIRKYIAPIVGESLSASWTR